MVYYCCALFFEARPFIARYGMKQVGAPGRFRFFVSEKTEEAGCAGPEPAAAETAGAENAEETEQRRRLLPGTADLPERERPAAALVVSGSGSYAAATASAALFALYPPRQEDLFINFGLCGAHPASGLPVLTTCIAESVSCEGERRVLYPDRILPCDFTPVRLKTFPSPVSEVSPAAEQAYDAADMEGYGALYATMTFFECHRCFVIKTVSDRIAFSAESRKEDVRRETVQLDRKLAERAAEEGAARTAAFAEKAQQEAAGLLQRIPALPEEERAAAEALCSALSLSFAQREQLGALLRRRMLRGLPSAAMIRAFLLQEAAAEAEGADRSRREGKKRFEKFKGFVSTYD